MAKMIRALLMLGGVLLTTANDSAGCALEGAGAMDEMLDSAVYIWASTKRCGEGGNKLQCAVDVTSAIESVNGMINVILKAIQSCGSLNTQKSQCATTALGLTQDVAGLAAHTAGVLAKCKVPGVSPGSSDTLPGTMDDAATYGHTEFGARKIGMCVVDVKATAKSFFMAVKSIMTVSKHSNVENALRIIEAFASMGEYIAASIGDCSAEKQGDDVECASQALGLVKELHSVAVSSIALSKHCALDEKERLYLENADDDQIALANSGSSMTLALVAFLPITAVASFVGGSRFAKARANAPREFESLELEAPVVE